MRREARNGVSTTQLATEHGVSWQVASRAIRGWSYAHVTEEPPYRPPTKPRTKAKPKPKPKPEVPRYDTPKIVTFDHLTDWMSKGELASLLRRTPRDIELSSKTREPLTLFEGGLKREYNIKRSKCRLWWRACRRAS